VGGRILLAFPGTPPAWLSSELHAALSAFDLGATARDLRYGQATYPFGANIGFRTAAVQAAGGFSSNMGLLGRRQLLHEETDLCYRLEHAGGVIRYAPDAVVDHHVVPERLTPHWMLRRHWTGGQSAAVFILRNRGLARAVWRLWWLYRGALTTLPYDTSEPIDPNRFAHECRRREALGYVTGLVRALPRLAELRRDMAA
jgi:cellulose synthase/poly-beta-1,6-N-acetylglucosamine synthase-like glycosyltransferase